MTASHEEWIICGWTLVYYFREYPHQCDYTVKNIWSNAGEPYQGPCVRDRTEGKLDPRLICRTKPARR